MPRQCRRFCHIEIYLISLMLFSSSSGCMAFNGAKRTQKNLSISRS